MANKRRRKSRMEESEKKEKRGRAWRRDEKRVGK